MLPKQKDEAFSLIQKEDSHLHEHLVYFEMDHCVYTLLSTCYAQVFDISLTIKVWDKVLGDFRQTMPKLTAVFLVAIKSNLIHTVEQEQLESILFQVRAQFLCTQVYFTNLISSSILFDHSRFLLTKMI